MSQNCKCLLSETGREVKFEGNLEAKVLFVLESPGRTDLREKAPCRGEAGTRLVSELNKTGLEREDVFITNTSRCALDKQSLTDSQIKKIIKSCRPALETAINHVKPKVIVTCGGIASHSVTGVPITGIKKRRGSWAYSEEFSCQVLYTINPSATLRNESDLPLLQQDFRILKAFIDNSYEIPTEKLDYREVDSIRFLLDKKDFTVGIDTETQGLKWFDKDFVFISYSVSDIPCVGYNIVLWEEVLPEEGSDAIPPYDKCIVWNRNKEDVPVFLKKANNYDVKMKELRELLTRKDIKKYTKNGIGYDEHVFSFLGLPRIVNHAMDTQLSSHTLDSELYLNNSLDALTSAFTTMTQYKLEFKETYDKADMLWSLRQNREAFTDYAAADSDSSLRVGLAIREELIKDPITANYYLKLIHPVSSTALYNISKNGMVIDQTKIKKAEVEVLEELDVCEKECIKRIPETVRARHVGLLNLNRDALIADTLFSEDGFGLIPKVFTAKKKTPSVNKNTLKQIKNNSKKEVRDFLEWRENREELNTTYTNYIKSLQKFIASDGRIHTSMSISGTSSGRVSSRKPNTMVFPSRNKKQANIIKGLFTAPTGFKILNLDQSQSELRILAHVTQDTRMMEAFKNDEDIHTITAKGMVARAGKNWDTLTTTEQKEARQKAKPINFGLPFAMSIQGLREYALNDYGIHLSQKESKEMWESWHHLYPGIRLWHDACRTEMYRDGKVRTIFGRNRWLRNLNSSEEWVIKNTERTGINVLIQGPSSDYTLLGAKQLYDEGIIDTKDIQLVNFVHDSLVFYIKEDKIEELVLILKQKMEHVNTSDFGFELSVPMKVDIQVGDSLATLEDYKM